jgi:hypothetical protein
MKVRYVIAAVVLASITGCAAVKKTREVAVGATAWLTEGIVNGVFDRDETIIEQDHRERNERKWKQVWRDNPDESPTMTAAFKDDHE